MSNPHVHRSLLCCHILVYSIIALLLLLLAGCPRTINSEINDEVVEQVLSRSGYRVSGCSPVMVSGVQNDIHNS